MDNGNGEFPCVSRCLELDSPYTITVLGGNQPMDNGEHLLTQDEPSDTSHFITDYDWAGGMGNAE